MTTITLRTSTGTKPIERERLAALIAGGKVKPTVKAASIDEGKTWITVAEALAQSIDVVEDIETKSNGRSDQTEAPSAKDEKGCIKWGIGCITTFVAVIVLLVITPPYCSLGKGVPGAVWTLVETDFEQNNRAYAAMHDAERIQSFGASALNKTTRNNDALLNEYTYEVKIVGKTNAFGTHQEAVGNLRYKYDPDKGTIELLRIDVYNANWK